MSALAQLERARILLGESYAIREDRRVVDSHIPAIGWISELFIYAGLNQTERRTLKLRAILEFITVLILALIFKSPSLLLLLPVILLIEYLKLTRAISSRADRFERDYTALLLSLASGIRTGLDPLVAIGQSAALFNADSLVRIEVKKFQELIEQGVSEEQALSRFAESIKHSDIALFRSAMILARREGSALGKCLERLARVTRARQSFRRKIRSAIAMQKLSAWGIAGCTVIIGLIQFNANPQAIRDALAHPIGFKLLLGGVTLILIGMAWMMRIARGRV